MCSVTHRGTPCSCCSLSTLMFSSALSAALYSFSKAWIASSSICVKTLQQELLTKEWRISVQTLYRLHDIHWQQVMGITNTWHTYHEYHNIMHKIKNMHTVHVHVWQKIYDPRRHTVKPFYIMIIISWYSCCSCSAYITHL